jgi:uncharacterized membrane protein
VPVLVSLRPQQLLEHEEEKEAGQNTEADVHAFRVGICLVLHVQVVIMIMIVVVVTVVVVVVVVVVVEIMIVVVVVVTVAVLVAVLAHQQVRYTVKKDISKQPPSCECQQGFMESRWQAFIVWNEQ